MAKGLTARRKTKKQFSRRLQTGWGACPTKDFWAFKDYARTEMDKKEVAKTIKTYIRENFKDEKKLMLSAPDWMFTYAYYVGATIEWDKRDFEFPTRWGAKKCLVKYFDELRILAKREIAFKESELTSDKPKRTIQDIIKERTGEFIAEVEHVIDEFFEMDGPNNYFDINNYSVYEELQKVTAPNNMAKAVYDYYLPIKVEAELILSPKCPVDLAEGYAHWTKKRKEDYLKLLTLIVDDADKYMLSKKAARKTRVARPKSSDKQIKHLKFLKESNEFKLTSVNPINIVGGMRLYTFNVKSRILTEYVCRSAKGFEVKGSTLQFVDEEVSRETKLRKPDDFLPIAMKQSPTKVNIAWKTLTTKTNVPNARINKDTILLRVLDR